MIAIIFSIYLSLSFISIMSAFSGSPVICSTVKIEELLKEIRLLPLIKQRAIAAIVGASVADAATRPFHWLYDVKKLEEIVGDGDPAFWSTSQSPYYTLETGRRSCYNDICYCMLRSLSNTSKSGYFEKESFIKSVVDLFAPPSEYSTAFVARKEAYDPAKRTEDRQPIPGPWQQQSITNFLDNVQTGYFDGNPTVKETDGLMASIPLIAKLVAEGIDVTKSKTISDAAELLSSNPFCIRHTYASASILQEAIVNGCGLDIEKIKDIVPKEHEIDQQILEELESITIAVNNKQPYSEAVEKWGRPCANPGSFQGSVYSIVTSNSFKSGIRKTILAGGCNCSRSNFIGCVLAAIHGFDEQNGLTLDWLSRTDKVEEILRLSIDLFKI